MRAPPPVKSANSKHFSHVAPFIQRIFKLNIKGNFYKKTSTAGFTLAEVLITLGIIGIVAAMTFPIMIQGYRKKVVETRLARFYSVMNQAIANSEVDNGPKEYWDEMKNGFVVDEDGNKDMTQSAVMPWYDKYLKNYLKVTSVKINPTIGNLMLYFPDGSLAVVCNASIQYWIKADDFKDYTISESGNWVNNMELSGIKYFTFMFWPAQKSNKYAYRKGLEPYKNNNWDGKAESLIKDKGIGCQKNVSNERAYCAALIQMNGWKIPKNYPLKF